MSIWRGMHTLESLNAGNSGTMMRLLEIVFTEIGYRSADFGAWRQWEIPEDAPVNLEVQSRAYEAFFEAVWSQPWLAGAYFWKWFSSSGRPEPSNSEFEMESKPAESVLARYYRTP